MVIDLVEKEFKKLRDQAKLPQLNIKDLEEKYKDLLSLPFESEKDVAFF